MVYNELIAAGDRVLQNNEMPGVEELNLAISNAKTGHNLLMLGLAKSQGDSIRNLFGTMNLMESQLFTPETMASLSFEQRLALYKEAKHSTKFRFDFGRQVREDVNIGELQTDVLVNDKRIKTGSGLGKEERKVIREKLIQTITNTRTVTVDNVNTKPNNIFATEAEVVEG